ncbi:hypothetical protein ACSDUA_003042 [Escherichia coli]|uniref:hypothetical protein n=1 Tax=Escherichia coli TaxID=562 RepID=UPI001384C293|nr:hypothetical protein [Escherichia coli]EBV7459757.1 hypothetical protein [Salmonella enterica subsp. enterica serovar Mbandaka]
MGLDIFFLGRDRVCVTDAVVSVPETREVGYFRKVNPLIAWFEKHCGPIENAVERPVSRTELEALLSDLECLTPENCREFFPTTEGFFFGSQEYDQYYWKDVEDVKSWVRSTLDSFDFERKILLLWAWW